MILNVYAIYDAAIASYNQPFYLSESSTHDEARRVFALSVADKGTKFYQSPHDFMLVYCGHFDDQRGNFETTYPPLRIMSAVEALQLYRSQRAVLLSQLSDEITIPGLEA